MLMNSYTLKKQRNDFIKNIETYHIKYKSVLEKIKKINISLEYSNDTLLYNFIRENNTKIVEKINKLLIEVENDKQAVIRKIDAKIFQLEEYERIERERLEREKLEQGIYSE